MKYTFTLVAFTLGMCVQKSLAQASFSVVCPETEIGKNELLKIEFKVENAEYIETIIPPTFNDFNIVSGPNQQRGMRSVNGKTDTYVSISFSLQPMKPGTYKIGPAKAIADGKEFTTKPLTIKVSNKPAVNPSAGQRSNTPFPPGFGNIFPPLRPSARINENILKPGENPEEKLKNNIFIKLDINKTNCYVGEPITAAFKVYSRLNCQTQITEAPSFDGFSVSYLDINRETNVEEYNGRKYNVYVLRKVQLYPLLDGDITLSPLVSENRVRFIKSEYADRQNDPFFNLLENFTDENSPENSIIERNVELKSEARTVHVKPLPDKDVPSNFKGAVGDFSIEASVDKQQLTTDDAGNLQITISGSGNIQLVNAPVITWPDGIDGFEARMKEDLDKSLVPINGRKVFTYPFTISKTGDVIIPSISFSYFDPKAAVYKTVDTKPITLQVKAGSKKPISDVAKSKNKESDNLFKVSKSEIVYGIVGTILIILLILLFKRNQTRKKENRKKDIILDDLENRLPSKADLFTIPENPLLEAHEKLTSGNANEFFIVLNSSMKKYLSGKFKIPPEEFSRKRIYEEMDTRNVGIGTSHMVNSLLEEIEMNLYSMPQQQHLQDAFEKASEVVALLDKQCQGRGKTHS